MADLPRSDLETDEAPGHLQMRRLHGRVPQLHPTASSCSTTSSSTTTDNSMDDKHHQPCTLENRVDSGVGYSLESQEEYSALSIEGVRDFMSSDCGRVCYRQHMMDNRRADSISASLQNHFRNLSLHDSPSCSSSSSHCDNSSKDSVRSSRCDSGICDSGICVSAGSSCFSGVDPHHPHALEAAFPEVGLTSSGQFDNAFSHQELQELFSQDEDGDTYLHMSIIHQVPDLALKVISVAPDPELVSIPNCLHQTPLHLAVTTNQPLVARRLMVAGASLQAPDHQGNTPLHIACRQGNTHMVQLLLSPVLLQETLANQYPLPMHSIPQDLALRNYEGYTCAHLALQGGHLSVLQQLLTKGANINEADGKSGRTLLHMAADLGFLPALQMLIRQRGLQLDARTYGGLTAVTLAHGRRLDHVVDLLHRAGADCSQINAADFESGESSDEDMNDQVYDDICINGRPIQIS